MLTIGVLFDGTGNNAVMLKAYTAGHYDLNDPEAESILAKCARENFGLSGSDANSYTGYYTNIHWLSTLYRTNEISAETWYDDRLPKIGMDRCKNAAMRR